VITLGRSPVLPNLIRIRWAVETPRDGNIYGYCDLFFTFFIFFNRVTAHTRELIFAQYSSKDSVWCEKDPFWGWEMCNSEIVGCLTLKTPPKIGRKRQNKMSNNSETVRDMRNVPMNHDYKTGVTLSDSVNKTCVKRSLTEKSRWRHVRLAIKPRYLGNHVT